MYNSYYPYHRRYYGNYCCRDYYPRYSQYAYSQQSIYNQGYMDGVSQISYINQAMPFYYR